MTGSNRGTRGWRRAGAALAVAGFAAACGSNGDIGTGSADRRPDATAPSPATAATAPDGSPAAEGAPATVTFVFDGDTIEVDVDGAVERVRLIGIDTPEPTGGNREPECFGDEATARTRELLPREAEVRLVRDVEARDRFERLLAYVFLPDGTFVNLELVRDGYAVAFPFEPNTGFADDFEAAEQRAREINLGLWARCGGPDVPLGG